MSDLTTLAVSLSKEQQVALYRRCFAQLEVFDDLLSAVGRGELEEAYRQGRRLLDALRLIQEGLGWGEDAPALSSQRAIPAEEFASILARVRDEAIAQYEFEKPEQEAMRKPWEETALVRDACEELIPALLAAPDPPFATAPPGSTSASEQPTG